MKRIILSLLLAAAPLTFASAVEEALSGAAIESVVAGRTLYIETSMGEVPIRYAKNGSVHGNTELALLDGESTAVDHGKWWVADNKLCLRWRNWMNGETHCFTVRRLGATHVRWRREDGKSGVARLG